MAVRCFARPHVFVVFASAAVFAAATGDHSQTTGEQLVNDNVALQAELASVRHENADFRRQLSLASSNVTSNVTHQHYDTVLGEIGFKVTAFLRESWYQSMIAIAVLFVGLLSILDAVCFMRCVSVGAAAVAVGMLANNEASEAWHGALGDTEMWVVGIEASTITAAAAYVGFAGFQLIAGACLALGSAHFAARSAMIIAWQPEKTFMFFVLSAALGVAGMRAGDKVACAILGPATGGLMVASGVIFFLDKVNITATASPPWIDFADALISPGGASNIFGDGETFEVARAIGFTIWFLVALLGFSRYYFECPSFGFFDGLLGFGEPRARENGSDLTMPLANNYNEPSVPPRTAPAIKYNDYKPRAGSAGGPPGPPPPFRGGRG